MPYGIRSPLQRIVASCLDRDMIQTLSDIPQLRVFHLLALDPNTTMAVFMPMGHVYGKYLRAKHGFS